MSTERIGRYEIKAEQGRGGMATVYHAYDPRFGRDVAIKVLPQQFLHDPLFRERFDREAHTIAALEHGAIVPVYDFGDDGGQPYLVMRYMTGGSLAGRLKDGALPIEEAASIITRVSAALDEAHKRKIIHRDLKPGNVLFDQYGDAFLSDFGIAKLTEATAALTGSAVIGTPAYMSPEQARGDAGVDGRSDIYSLGVILFEMLTGQAPYEADTPMGVAIKHILDPVPRILSVNPDLPDDIEGIISRAMAKDANARFQSAGEMASALAAVAAGQPLPEGITLGPTTVNIPPRPGGDMPIDEGTINLAGAKIAAPTPPPIPAMQHGVHSMMEMHDERKLARERELTARAERKAVETRAKADERIAKAEAYAAEQRAYGKSHHGGNPWPRRMFFGCALLVLIIAVTGVSGLFGLMRGAFGMAMQLPIPKGEGGGELQLYQIGEAAEDVKSLEVTMELTAIDTRLAALDGDEPFAFQGEYQRAQKLNYLYEVEQGEATLDIREADNSGIPGDPGSMALGLSRNIPIDLTIKVGAGDAEIDLSDLQLTSLTIEGGAGGLSLTLPSSGELDVHISSGAGAINIEPPDDTSELTLKSITIDMPIGNIDFVLPANGNFDVDISALAGTINLTVPDALQARIAVNKGVGHVTIDDDVFVAISETEWQTPDYVGAEDRARITIDAGIATVLIRD